MSSIKDLPCWEIMNCGDDVDCPAKQNPDQSCWSIAQKMEDYRTAYDICKDCIVYMVKNNGLVLSAQEINNVREQGSGSCVLATQK